MYSLRTVRSVIRHHTYTDTRTLTRLCNMLYYFCDGSHINFAPAPLVVLCVSHGEAPAEKRRRAERPSELPVAAALPPDGALGFSMSATARRPPDSAVQAVKLPVAAARATRNRDCHARHNVVSFSQRA